MSFLSTNTFSLGVMLFLAISLSTFIYSWLCSLWKIKITEFGVFYNPGFSLFKKTINGTNFVLGWIPLSSHIRPFGSIEEELKDISPVDLPFTYLGKSKTQRAVFNFIPASIWLFMICLSLYTLDNSNNIVKNAIEIGNYLLHSFKAMFSLIPSDLYLEETKRIVHGKNLISFSLILMMSVFLLTTLLNKLFEEFSKNKKSQHWIITLISLAYYLFLFYFILWKIPFFVFSFLTFGQIIYYLLGFILGLYLSGIAVFVITILIVKLNNFKT